MSLPSGANPGNRRGYIAAFICENTIAGWPIPCHIQTKSTTLPAENQIINVNWFRNTQNFQGVYRFGKVVKKGIQVGDNPKAGMDADEFKRYLINRILSLYPDTMDVALNHVSIIVDGCAGRLNLEMLAKL